MESISLQIGIDPQGVSAARRIIIRDLQTIERQAGQLEVTLDRLSGKLNAVLAMVRVLSPEVDAVLAAARDSRAIQGASVSLRGQRVVSGLRSGQAIEAAAPAIAGAVVTKIFVDQFESFTKKVVGLGQLSEISEIPISELDRLQLTARLAGVEVGAFQESIRSLTTDLALLQAGSELPLRKLDGKGAQRFRSGDGSVVPTGEALSRLIQEFNELDSVREQLVLLTETFDESLAHQVFPFFQRFAETQGFMAKLGFFDERLGNRFLDERLLEAAEAAQTAFKLLGVTAENAIKEVGLEPLAFALDSPESVGRQMEAAKQFIDENLESAVDEIQGLGDQIAKAVRDSFDALIKELKEQFDPFSEFLRNNQSPPAIAPDAANALESFGDATAQLVSASESLVAPLGTIADLREREAAAILAIVAARHSRPDSGTLASARVIPASFERARTIPAPVNAGGDLTALAKGIDEIKQPAAEATQAALDFDSAWAGGARTLREESLPAFEEACTATESLGRKTSAEAQIIEEVLRGAFVRV